MSSRAPNETTAELLAAVLSKIVLIFSSCANLFSSAGKWDESAAIILIGCRWWRRRQQQTEKKKQVESEFFLSKFHTIPSESDVEERSSPRRSKSTYICSAKCESHQNQSVREARGDYGCVQFLARLLPIWREKWNSSAMGVQVTLHELRQDTSAASKTQNPNRADESTAQRFTQS